MVDHQVTVGLNRRVKRFYTGAGNQAHNSGGTGPEPAQGVSAFSNERVTDYGEDPKHLIVQIRHLEEELQRAREESFKVGYEEGRESSLDESKRQMEEMSRNVMQMIEGLKEQFESTLLKMDEPLMKLARKMAEKVVGAELQAREDYDTILFAHIKHMLNEVLDQKKITIRINPELLPLIQKSDLTREVNLPKNAQINILGDPTLALGECILETPDYFVDGTFESNLKQLERQLFKAEA